jgi:hypothetical protein
MVIVKNILLDILSITTDHSMIWILKFWLQFYKYIFNKFSIMSNNNIYYKFTFKIVISLSKLISYLYKHLRMNKK